MAHINYKKRFIALKCQMQSQDSAFDMLVNNIDKTKWYQLYLRHKLYKGFAEYCVDQTNIRRKYGYYND